MHSYSLRIKQGTRNTGMRHDTAEVIQQIGEAIETDVTRAHSLAENRGCFFTLCRLTDCHL